MSGIGREARTVAPVILTGFDRFAATSANKEEVRGLAISFAEPAPLAQPPRFLAVQKARQQCRVAAIGLEGDVENIADDGDGANHQVE